MPAFRQIRNQLALNISSALAAWRDNSHTNVILTFDFPIRLGRGSSDATSFRQCAESRANSARRSFRGLTVLSRYEEVE